jgi:hypothetical protein
MKMLTSVCGAGVLYVDIAPPVWAPDARGGVSVNTQIDADSAVANKAQQ